MDAAKDFPQVKAILSAIRLSLQELQYSFFGTQHAQGFRSLIKSLSGNRDL